ncbi:MAG: hypothetical protein AABX11_01285 [Nanoarchaeota archaeon]
MKEEEKLRFMSVYQNLPLTERRNTILVLEKRTDKNKAIKEPISWDVAFLEVSQKTKVGKVMLDKLIRLDLI